MCWIVSWESGRQLQVLGNYYCPHFSGDDFLDAEEGSDLFDVAKLVNCRGLIENRAVWLRNKKQLVTCTLRAQALGPDGLALKPGPNSKLAKVMELPAPTLSSTMTLANCTTVWSFRFFICNLGLNLTAFGLPAVILSVSWYRSLPHRLMIRSRWIQTCEGLRRLPGPHRGTLFAGMGCPGWTT